MIDDSSQIRDITKRQLVQEYITNPFLMEDKLKFDFRVYAVLKSINPLEIYVSREGALSLFEGTLFRLTCGFRSSLYFSH
ncbi:unnamed protein product [Heligmosomoides polygyrus]|uniref:Neur_chan_LBD domain-containing protein n=1 Tax=Heligmosomoides polygyrus TaxID=6339 RepID=A0A183F8N2_HELPZ|nr:unnamed protein product [Heligmosomoides polygyrus]